MMLIMCLCLVSTCSICSHFIPTGAMQLNETIPTQGCGQLHKACSTPEQLENASATPVFLIQQHFVKFSFLQI